jgi:D-glycero-alpha-D-manno-heptose-7-phosphate kinase
LFYTGVSRLSAAIIDEQTKNIGARSESTALAAMHHVKAEALRMKESLLRGDLNRFYEAINSAWESKKRTAQGISNHHIEQIYVRAVDAGARAGRVSGAGGGGVMMFFVDPERRMDVHRALEQDGGQLFTCHFTEHGTEGWKIF